MKQFAVLLIVFFQLTAMAHAQSPGFGEPIVKADTVLKDLMSFLVYRQKHIRFYEDFIALDSASFVIDRKTFLKKLATGKYLPLRLTSNNTSTYYQLHPIVNYDNDIKNTIRQWGEHLYSFYKMEGTQLPEFNFTDIEGKKFTRQNTKGKIIAIKCWFIGCIPCIKEMPSLNKLVESYSNADDVVFFSLAMDGSKELKVFLGKTSFRYAVIADKKNYMIDELKVTGFPTHIVVGKNGLIAKMVDNDKELAVALQNEMAK